MWNAAWPRYGDGKEVWESLIKCSSRSLVLNLVKYTIVYPGFLDALTAITVGWRLFLLSWNPIFRMVGESHEHLFSSPSACTLPSSRYVIHIRNVLAGMLLFIPFRYSVMPWNFFEKLRSPSFVLSCGISEQTPVQLSTGELGVYQGRVSCIV